MIPYSATWYGRRWHDPRVVVRVVAGPDQEQISLADARDHLRLVAYGSPLAHPDDDWIEAQIPTARELVEAEVGRALAPQTLELSMPWFPNAYAEWWCAYRASYEASLIKLPMAAPLIGVVSVTYVGSDGVDVVMDPNVDFQVDLASEPAAIYPPYGGSWPTPRDVPNAVRVRYLAGYDLPGSSPTGYVLPSRLRSAMLLTLGHLYENREATTDERFLQEIPLGVQSLIQKLCIDWGMA